MQGQPVAIPNWRNHSICLSRKCSCWKFLSIKLTLKTTQMKGKFKCESTTIIIVVDFALSESLTLLKEGLKITLYALAGRYFGSDGWMNICFRLTGARYLNRTIPPRAVRGTLSLTGARYLSRTITPRAVRGTLSLAGARYFNRAITPRAVQGTCSFNIIERC